MARPRSRRNKQSNASGSPADSSKSQEHDSVNTHKQHDDGDKVQSKQNDGDKTEPQSSGGGMRRILPILFSPWVIAAMIVVILRMGDIAHYFESVALPFVEDYLPVAHVQMGVGSILNQASRNTTNSVPQKTSTLIPRSNQNVHSNTNANTDMNASADVETQVNTRAGSLVNAADGHTDDHGTTTRDTTRSVNTAENSNTNENNDDIRNSKGSDNSMSTSSQQGTTRSATEAAATESVSAMTRFTDVADFVSESTWLSAVLSIFESEEDSRQPPPTCDASISSMKSRRCRLMFRKAQQVVSSEAEVKVRGLPSQVEECSIWNRACRHFKRTGTAVNIFTSNDTDPSTTSQTDRSTPKEPAEIPSNREWIDIAIAVAAFLVILLIFCG
mmetsp:Transcript_20369/g.56697  ORF Transcript_20369/g.56697 Transcript_20369/m.56697 type:complete len:387 (-) Transcript_20369:123-1283(-)